METARMSRIRQEEKEETSHSEFLRRKKDRLKMKLWLVTIWDGQNEVDHLFLSGDEKLEAKNLIYNLF